MKRFRLLWLILFGLTATVLRAAWTPETLPMVHLADARRYVCNPDGLMSAAAVDSTDTVLHRLEREKGIESLVVIVRQIEGGDPYEFGMALARKYGVGSQSGSQKTPLGWHRVEERYGAKAAPGTVFVSRRPDGRILRPEHWSDPAPAEDLVLTRILWLRGLEPGQNAGRAIDSHERCIYLHGTNQEQLLGTPASHGCIRFSNEDMIQLFSLSDGVSLYCYIR